MHSILRTLPIRWQITLLNGAILALVLGAGGVALWNAQRTFQYDGMIAKQLMELRSLLPAEIDIKRPGAYPVQKIDPEILKERYAKIAAAILPPGQDLAVARKKLGLLDPKLADQIFPPGSPLPPRDKMEGIVSKLVFELFPLGEDPKDMHKRLSSLDPKLAAELFPAPTPDQAAFQKYLTGFVEQGSAKDRGVVIFALDGAVLAKNSFGPACAPSAYVSKAALAANAGEDFFKQLKVEQYVAQIEAGQLSLLLPVMWQQDQPMALAQICVPTDSIDDSLKQLAVSLVIGWVLVVGVATALGVTATRQVLRPLDQVVATTGRIAAGDLKQRVGLPPGRTEIAQLGAAFDAMVARLEQAFIAQRRFVADAAHELRTPLTALSTSVELLLIGAADNDRATAQRLLRHLDSELNRVIRLTNDLLTLSQLDAHPQVALRPINLNDLLEDLGEHSRMQLRGQELIVDLAPGLWVEGDADRIQQIVLNLLDNARKYTPPGGRIMLRAYADQRLSAADNGRSKIEDGASQRVGQLSSSLLPPSSNQASVVVIEVEDNGVGIPTDALAHLFERFYRVDSARARASGGSGLGLAIVQAIAQAHHGQVDIQSAPGVGTCVMIQLPRLLTPYTQPASPQSQTASAPLQSLVE
jgi:signal transduction histidine kinase